MVACLGLTYLNYSDSRSVNKFEVLLILRRIMFPITRHKAKEGRKEIICRSRWTLFPDTERVYPEVKVPL